jgi:hypothetical protein
MALSFRGSVCDSNQCLVDENVREILAVVKQAVQKLDGEIFNLRNQNDLEVRKEYQVEISKRFAVFQTLSDSEVKIGLGRTLKTLSKPQEMRV